MNRVYDVLRFVITILREIKPHFVAAFVLRPESLSESLNVVGDYGIGGVEDGFGASIVFFEPEYARTWEIFFKVEDVANVGATPRVNTLVFITHNENITSVAAKLTCDNVLGTVGVLVFVYEDIFVPTSVFRGDFGVFQEEFCGEYE